MARDEYDDDPRRPRGRAPREADHESDAYRGGYGGEVADDPGAQRRWSAGGGFSGHSDGYGRGGSGPGEYGFSGGMARGPETEWGGGYAGGYGRQGDYGRRGGFGPQTGPLQGEWAGEPGGYYGAQGVGYGGLQGRGEGRARTSFAGRGPRGYRRSDGRINEDVCEALTRHPDIDATDVEVRVENGIVVLSGAVDSRYSKRLAEDIADGVFGVSDVRNELHIGPDRTGGDAGGRNQ